MEITERLQAVLDSLPTRPGCYLMKDEQGEVIYVGKAINLRNRVRSYFHASAQEHPRTRQLVQRIADIEWIVVDSELEALILEMNLIKKHRPRYNVRLKDDKRYPYIKIHWQDDYPRVTVTRRVVDDGARYFGPYTSVWAVHQTLDVLRRVFPYLTCSRTITGEDPRACLYYDIKLCAGPCIGAVSRQQYRDIIAGLERFLQGDSSGVLESLRAEMQQAANTLQFERAAALRDQIAAIEQILARQKMVLSGDFADTDVIALARDERDACVQVFFIRGGKLIGREYFLLEGAEGVAEEDMLAEFVKQFYDQTPTLPQQVLLPRQVEEARIIRQWLKRRRGASVQLRVPRQGQRRELVRMAAENAAETLRALRAQWESDKHRQTQALSELHEALDLPRAPRRIECYDISNTQGVAMVGSMVVFEQGVPYKQHYRRFNIRNVTGPDDFASMEEVLTRRFRRWQAAHEMSEAERQQQPVDASFAALPDLIIIDGGKGQLGRAVQVLQAYGLAEVVPVIGLAKREEEIFIPGRKDAIRLPSRSEGLYLIQRIRDEAHRFAITAHRKRRSRQGLASQLEAIPGIGPARRKALLQHFGSIEAIRQASEEDLAAAPKMNALLAARVKEFLE